MSTRRNNVVERHFEKVLLAVVALAMLGWVAMDLMMVGETPVKMGASQVPLSKVNEELQKKASKVAAALRSDQATLEGLESDGPGSTALDPASMAGLSPKASQPLPRVQIPLAAKLFNPDLAGRQVWYREPSFGPVSMLSPVAEWSGALSAETLQKETALAAALDARSGWDKGNPNLICTMPAARVNLAAIREELKRDDPSASPPRSAVPPAWRNSSVIVIDAIFERQERQPDGSWGPTSVVPTLPGRMTLRELQANEGGPFLDALRANPTLQGEILQPTFFPLAGGQVATLGGPAEDAVQEDPAILSLRADVRRRQQELDRLEKELQEAGGEYRKPPSSGAGGGGGMGGPGGGGPGGGTSPPKGGDDEEKKLRTRARLTRARDEAAKALERVEASLAAKLPKTDAAQGEDKSAATTEPAAPSGGINLNLDQEGLVWTHDWTVRPGAEYRYRCRLAILNPFLGRSRQLVEAQKRLDTEWGSRLLTAPSDWVECRALAPSVFYALGGSPDSGTAGLGTGKMEVFSLEAGRWRKQEETDEPGDLIGRRLGAEAVGGRASGTEYIVVAVLEDLASQVRGSRERPVLVVVAPVATPRLEVRFPALDNADPGRARLLTETQKSALDSPGDS